MKGDALSIKEIADLKGSLRNFRRFIDQDGFECVAVTLPAGRFVMLLEQYAQMREKSLGSGVGALTFWNMDKEKVQYGRNKRSRYGGKYGKSLPTSREHVSGVIDDNPFSSLIAARRR